MLIDSGGWLELVGVTHRVTTCVSTGWPPVWTKIHAHRIRFQSFLVFRIERRILGDHPKAHASGFHENRHFSPGNLINQLTEHKLFSFMVCREEAMSQVFMKTGGFHTKDHQLPGMVTPMLNFVLYCKVCVEIKTSILHASSLNQIICWISYRLCKIWVFFSVWNHLTLMNDIRRIVS